MDNEQQNENVTLLYIQKQEQMILEYARKQVDYEIKIHLMNDKLNQQIEKIKELIQTVESQSNIINQATNSINILTEEKKLISQNDRTEELQKTVFELSNNNNELKNKINILERKNFDLQTELTRQNEELTKLYNSDNASKKKLKKVQEETF